MGAGAPKIKKQQFYEKLSVRKHDNANLTGSDLKMLLPDWLQALQTSAPIRPDHEATHV